MLPTPPIEIDRVYTKSLAGQIRIGDLSEVTIHNLFRDGRAASRVIEQLLPQWFPELVYVDGIGHDYVVGAQRYECKTFTKNGLCFAPPNMTGKGRSIDKEMLRSAAEQLIYIFCDITEFPVIRIVFKQGNELIAKYPNGTIKVAHKYLFFG